MTGQQASIGHVGEAVPLLVRARKQEWTTCLPADRRVDCKCHAHVHGVTNSVTNDRMWPMHAPSEAIAPRRDKPLVFLGIVEIIDIEPWLIFAKRCRGEGTFAVGFEGTEVMLQSGHKRNVSHRT